MIIEKKKLNMKKNITKKILCKKNISFTTKISKELMQIANKILLKFCERFINIYRVSVFCFAKVWKTFLTHSLKHGSCVLYLIDPASYT